MLGHNSGRFTSFLMAGSLALTLCFSPGFAAAADARGGAVQTASTPTEPADGGAQPAGKKTVRQKVKAALHKINPMRMLRDKEFKKASVLFPAFCKDWEHKLREREVNNQKNIAWQAKDGYETGTYVGYGPVNYCEAHQSSEGFSIGKLKYDEVKYYIAGKTRDEAEHAKPQVQDTTATTELFRWDKGKWFY